MTTKIHVAATTATISWAKIRNFDEPTGIGNHTMMVASDDVIRFYNAETKKEHLYHANGDDLGDGITAAIGHRHLPIFAFSELSIKPRIFILTYPDFKMVNILPSSHQESYEDVRFSETEYLIALSGLPEYALEIWNWRLAKLLATVNTGVIAPNQIIRMNRNNPLMAAQYAPSLGLLTVWEVHLSMDQAFLIKRPTTTPFANKDARMSYTFGTDNNVYAVDNIGNFYCIIPLSGNSKLLWKYFDPPGSKITYLVFYKGGYAVAGSTGTVTYLKKAEGIYTSVWSLNVHSDLKCLRVLNGMLYGINARGNIKLLEQNDESKTEVMSLHDTDTTIKCFEIIYPVGLYVVVETGHNELELLETSTGERMAKTVIANIVCMRSNPLYPYVAVGNQMGVVTLVSYYTPEKPTILTEFHLSGTWIDGIQFTHSGDILIASDRYGDYYIITGRIGGRMDVFVHFNYEFPVLSMCAQKHDDFVTIMLLSTMRENAENETSSNKATKVDINLINRELTMNVITLPDRYTSFSAMAPNWNQLLGTGHLNRDIHVMELFGETLKVVEVLSTFHQLKVVSTYTDWNHIITWGMDGIVCVFDATTRKMETMYFAQNRHSHRIRNVRADPARQFIISLGYHGTLKCFQIEPNNALSPKIYELSTSLNSEAIKSLFSKPTKGFVPSGEDHGKTWLELKQKHDLERESAIHQNQKDEIYNDFKNLQGKLQVLIDKNSQLPEAEKLPLQNFNLSKDWSESLLELARKERDLEDRTMKAYVANQNRIIQWIIDNTWNRMSVQGYKIRGIFSSICCENYPLLYTDKVKDDDLKRVMLWRNIENMVARVDKFLPWIPKTVEQMEELLAKKPEYIDDEAGFKHSTSSSETEVQDHSVERVQTKNFKYALSGTSTHRFIEPIPNRYEQLDVVTFEQTFTENILGQYDMYNLRLHFNRAFQELYLFKQDQMEHVKKRNNRLRKIQIELEILAQLKGSNEIFDEQIIDPEYEFDEQPEKIIKVEDYEVKVAPYVSPNRQKLLDEEAYNLELKRQALLADDFRERALIAMMDGVLEKRWEDEIKKSPPLPDCIKNDKKHEDYSKDDVRAVNDYDAQVKFLSSERDKYRAMLLEESTKLRHLQSDMITKFNMKCSSLFMLKYQIDGAIKQEELKLLRNSLCNYERIIYKRKEISFMNDLSEKKREIEKLLETLDDLEKRVNDWRARYDQLQTRDRLLDRQFKGQFSENAAQVIVDQAYKIFKKRPKWITRAWATAAILYDIANRIATKNNARTGAPIPEECYDFLGLIESLENYSHAPNSITPHLWGILCQLRRHKMESEFKLKAQGIQLAEAEATLAAFTKELAIKKLAISDMEKLRDERRLTYFENLQNRSIQLVMPKGLIEIPLTGHLNDFEGNVLLHTSDIGDINNIIAKAGQIKLRTMNRSAVFRRKIIYKEWEHKKLQMEVKNLQDYLAIIEKCKVTKEIQVYLKRKNLGLADDLSQAALNREIEATRLYLKKSIDEINKSVEKVSHHLAVKKRENNFLDAEIARINIDVTEQNLIRDYNMEEKERKNQRERMATVVERGKLIRRVQAQHAQILELSTMLELQRLRTFPTLSAAKTNTFS